MVHEVKRGTLVRFLNPEDQEMALMGEVMGFCDGDDILDMREDDTCPLGEFDTLVVGYHDDQIVPGADGGPVAFAVLPLSAVEVAWEPQKPGRWIITESGARYFQPVWEGL
jgi:hypothetical protein